METNATKRTDLFWIDPRNIDIQDGFNVRREFDLDELKELDPRAAEQLSAEYFQED